MMEPNEKGLLPCPFCGNRDPFYNTCGSYVQCRVCWCRSPLHGKTLTEQEREGLTEKEIAIKAWNKRA